jgi:hypothetical protein
MQWLLEKKRVRVLTTKKKEKLHWVACLTTNIVVDLHWNIVYRQLQAERRKFNKWCPIYLLFQRFVPLLLSPENLTVKTEESVRKEYFAKYVINGFYIFLNHFNIFPAKNIF